MNGIDNSAGTGTAPPSRMKQIVDRLERQNEEMNKCLNVIKDKMNMIVLVHSLVPPKPDVRKIESLTDHIMDRQDRNEENIILARDIIDHLNQII